MTGDVSAIREPRTPKTPTLSNFSTFRRASVRLSLLVIHALGLRTADLGRLDRRCPFSQESELWYRRKLIFGK